MRRQADPIPLQAYARTCGALYLYIVFMGIFSETFVRARLVVPSDPAATAANILADEHLFRFGFAGELLQLAFDVIIAVLLFVLLRPVHRNIALLAALMRLSCAIILAVASISHFAALRLIKAPDYLSALQPEQLNGLAVLAMKLHADAYGIALVFFGFACLALGYLIFKSGYLPRVIGILMAVAGAGYLVNSFASFLDPALAARLFPAILMPALVAELGLSLWLLIKGVDTAEWSRHGADGGGT
jgi:hypothetical protein